MAGLPKGFVVDTPQTAPVAQSNLPAGFVVDKPMTTGQKVGASAVGFAQGVSDVGQNIVGKPVGFIAEGLGNKIAGTKLGQAIVGGAEKLFGRDTVKQYQESEQAKMQQPGYNVAQGNIIETPLLNKEQQDSNYAKYGRVAGQFAGTTAVTAPIGGAFFGAAKALPTVGRVGVGLLGGATEAQVGTLASQGRFATPGETAVGSVLGGIGLGAFGGNKSNKIIKLVTEKGSGKNIEKAAEQGRIKFTNGLLSKGGEITPDEKTAYGARIIANEIKGVSTKNPQKLLTQITDHGRKIAQEKASEFSQIPYSSTNVKSVVSGKIKEIQGLSDEFDLDQVKQFKDFTKKLNNAKNVDDGWKTRIEWDNLFSSAQKNATDVSAPTTRKAQRLWQAVRNELNKDIDGTVRSSTAGEGTKEAFYKLSSLKQTSDNLLKKMPELAKKAPTKLGNLVKGAIAGGAGIGALAWLGKQAKGE